MGEFSCRWIIERFNLVENSIIHKEHFINFGRYSVSFPILNHFHQSSKIYLILSLLPITHKQQQKYSSFLFTTKLIEKETYSGSLGEDKG